MEYLHTMFPKPYRPSVEKPEILNPTNNLGHYIF